MTLRATTAIILFVSFIAMSTSGLLMLVIDLPSFAIRMHPVHKLFGVLMVLGVVSHLSLNYRALLAHTRQRAVAWLGTALGVILVLVYAAASFREINAEQAAILDQAAGRLEQGPGAPKP